MALRDQLAADLADAMRQRDAIRRDVLRYTIAAVKNAEIEAGSALDDDAVVAVLVREAKRRRESIDEFRKANRTDLVDKEEAEAAILASYLPEAVSRDEIVAAAREVIAATGATGPRELGKVMPVLMQRFAGRADGREVNEVVRELLEGSASG